MNLTDMSDIQRKNYEVHYQCYGVGITILRNPRYVHKFYRGSLAIIWSITAIPKSGIICTGSINGVHNTECYIPQEI